MAGPGPDHIELRDHAPAGTHATLPWSLFSPALSLSGGRKGARVNVDHSLPRLITTECDTRTWLKANVRYLWTSPKARSQAEMWMFLLTTRPK